MASKSWRRRRPNGSHRGKGYAWRGDAVCLYLGIDSEPGYIGALAMHGSLSWCP